MKRRRGDGTAPTAPSGGSSLRGRWITRPAPSASPLDDGETETLKVENVELVLGSESMGTGLLQVTTECVYAHARTKP